MDQIVTKVLVKTLLSPLKILPHLFIGSDKVSCSRAILKQKRITHLIGVNTAEKLRKLFPVLTFDNGTFQNDLTEHRNSSTCILISRRAKGTRTSGSTSRRATILLRRPTSLRWVGPLCTGKLNAY